MATRAAPEGALSLIWRDLQSRMRDDENIVARCRAAPPACTSAAALTFIAIVKEGTWYADDGDRYGNLGRIGRINRAVNLSIRPDRPGDVDRWTSPLAALAAGVGDCKQYAVVKYAALKAAGIAGEDLRIIIVQPRRELQPHAVVVVRVEGRWLVLDNRTLAIVESKTLLGRDVPLFSLDDRGVRQFELAVSQRAGVCNAGT